MSLIAAKFGKTDRTRRLINQSPINNFVICFSKLLENIIRKNNGASEIKDFLKHSIFLIEHTVGVIFNNFIHISRYFSSLISVSFEKKFIVLFCFE